MEGNEIKWEGNEIGRKWSESRKTKKRRGRKDGWRKEGWKEKWKEARKR